MCVDRTQSVQGGGDKTVQRLRGAKAQEGKVGCNLHNMMIIDTEVAVLCVRPDGQTFDDHVERESENDETYTVRTAVFVGTTKEPQYVQRCHVVPVLTQRPLTWFSKNDTPRSILKTKLATNIHVPSTWKNCGAHRLSRAINLCFNVTVVIIITIVFLHQL